MFTAKDVKVGNGSKYQSAGVSEKVTITEVMLNINEQYNSRSILLKTENEHKQEGSSKKLYLNTVLKEGSTITAWEISAKYLLNILMSTGKTREQADEVLEAKDETSLIKNLTNNLVGKTVRGLFGSREYNSGKFIIELYTTEPVGGTRLVWDSSNQYYNKRLPAAEMNGTTSTMPEVQNDPLPF